MRVRFVWDGGEAVGTLNDSDTARKLAAALPAEGQANAWGEEIYFQVPLDVELDANPKQVVDPGTICYWVQGGAVALPYGPTPISEGGECRLVTAVNIIGQLDGDPRVLDTIPEGATIRMEAVT